MKSCLLYCNLELQRRLTQRVSIRCAVKRRSDGRSLNQQYLTVFIAVGLSIVFGVHSGLAQENVNKSEPILPTLEVPQQVAEALENTCLDCHSGEAADADLDVEGMLFSLQDGEVTFADHRTKWEKVYRMLRSREMPPEDATELLESERQEVIGWINERLDEIDCSGEPFPGRVTLRRLNRAEYNNTVRDLLGVDFQPADDFPSDDVGNGFDNIGDVLVMPPLLVEKYLAAAEEIVTRAMADPDNRKRIIICQPENESQRQECAEKIIRNFGTQAFRRPLTDAELKRYFELGKKAFESGASYDQSLQFVLQAILVSPHFLFRVEADPDSGSLVRDLNDYEIASRLSYFLWSSMPDQELFELAKTGKLKQHEVLRAQVDRMLDDPKSFALVENFAGQWLQLRTLAKIQPDPDSFPRFSDDLRNAMRIETESLFSHLLLNNRSVLEFLNANYSFVNETLAQHYGIEGVSGNEFQMVSLPAERRGVLTHGSVLLITSNPTRTSPVKRGKWILENMLGEPPPPPPEGVEELEDQPELLGSLRERMEQHRENPSCAVCHRTMDSLGFGLENFDVIGSWRDKDGRHLIDPSGELPGKVEFQGSAELMGILTQHKRDDFCRCLTEKLLTYSLGRGLQTYDRCTVDAILKRLVEDEYQMRTIIKEIVVSDPFLKRASSREKP